MNTFSPTPEQAPPKRRTASAATRELVLRGAAREFSKNGYGATSIRDISISIGVPISVIMYHGRTKEQLFQDVVRTYLLENKRLEGVFAPVLKADQNNAQAVSNAIRDVVFNFLQVCHGTRKSDYVSGLLVRVYADNDAVAQKTLLELFTREQREIVPYLQKLRPDFDDQAIYSWLQHLWALVIYPVIAKPLIISELAAGRDYQAGWIEFCAQQIAYFCCLPLGLPTPHQISPVDEAALEPTPGELKGDDIVLSAGTEGSNLQS